MASVWWKSPRPARGSRKKAASASVRSPATAAATVQLGHGHVAADQLGVGRGQGGDVASADAVPSTTQIDSTTASAGTSGHLAGVGDVDRELAGARR